MLIRDLVIDPARVQELIDPEFVAEGPFLLVANERGRVGYRYDALPAAAAAEPTAFGCLVVENQRFGGSAALVAMLWDGFVTRIHHLSPVEGSTSTVAGRGEVASLSPEGARRSRGPPPDTS